MTAGARGIMAAADKIEARIVEAERMRSALDQLHRLHTPIIGPYGQDAGLVVVCDYCCFTESGQQSEDCSNLHDHQPPPAPACATAEIIGRAGINRGEMVC